MTDNVIPIGGLTLNDMPVEKIIDGAKDAGLVSVFVIGRKADGELYVAASTGRGGPSQTLYDFEEFKHALFSGDYGPPVFGP